MRTIALYAVIVFVLMTGTAPVSAQQTFTVGGTVVDSETGRPLTGANIIVKETELGAATDESGRYSIRNVPSGRQTLVVSYLGYFGESRETVIDKNLTEDFSLRQRVIESREVVVTATRAKERETPVAFANVDREDIEERYDMQDIPLLLSDQPGVYSYSETGATIGYTYMRIRGFDQSRIAVMLNGIPMNDPESHAVYWVDHADFGENVENIQIQRGVGNSLYGASAIGGSVNVITQNFSDERNISFKTGYGSYRTRKASLGLSSGLIDNKYAIYGRFSRLLSDGYRNQSWVDLWSYFFSAVRFDDNFTTKINIFGGPERTHLAYEGVTRDYLDGNVTGDKETDRKFNPLQGPNEVDDTFQPHYQVLNEWFINDDMYFTNSAFFIQAKGYYSNIKSRRDLFEYNLTPFTTTDPTPYLDFADFDGPDGSGLYEIDKVDLNRKRWIKNQQWGTIPRFEMKHRNGTLTAGTEIRIHSAHHWGEVTWVPVPFPNIDQNHRYYDYKVDKNSFTFFIHENYSVSEKLTLMTDFQYAYHKYEIYEDKRNDVNFDVGYHFPSPRLGANYNLNDRMNIFGNFSAAQREPTFRSIYDAQYAYSTPLFSGDTYDDPIIKPEKMFNYEAGFGYQAPKFSTKINLYYMDFRNELIRYGGQVDEEGIAVAGNAEKSYHAGVEVSSAAQVLPELKLDANVSFSRNKLVKHSEYANDWSTWPPGIIVNNYDGNTIGGFPSTILNAAATYRKEGFSGRVHVQYIGKQYLDNTENERKNPDLRNAADYVDKTIDPYALVNCRFSYALPAIMGLKSANIGLSIYNLLDTEYESAGYIDWVPLWIPGAGRNFLFTLGIEM